MDHPGSLFSYGKLFPEKEGRKQKLKNAVPDCVQQYNNVLNSIWSNEKVHLF